MMLQSAAQNTMQTAVFSPITLSVFCASIFDSPSVCSVQLSVASILPQRRGGGETCKYKFLQPPQSAHQARRRESRPALSAVQALSCRCDSVNKTIHPIYCHGNFWKDRQLPSCVKVHPSPIIPACHSRWPRMPPAICKSTFANPPDLCKVQFAVICDYLQIDKVSRPVTARLRYGMKLLRQLIFERH